MKAIYTVEIRKNKLLIDSKRDLELGALKSYVLANYNVLDEIYTFKFYQDLSLLDLDIKAEAILAAKASAAEDANNKVEPLVAEGAKTDDTANAVANIKFNSLFN